MCIRIASTFRKDCPAEIKFRASEDGCHLVVTSVVIDHNHELNKVCLLHKLIQIAFNNCGYMLSYVLSMSVYVLLC